MKKSFGLIAPIVVLALLVVLAWGAYQWFFCRFYIPPEHMGIVTAKSGAEPAAGQLLVERGEKGIWREVIPEGRHFLNPVMYDVAIVHAINIPLGKVGIVTSKVGRPLPPGEIIAPDRDSQGVWRDVLGPGVYRLNPQGYDVSIVDATNIPVGYVGVVTSQTGRPTSAGEFAGPGEKGVLKDILQPGLYYLNTRAYQINIIEIGMNQVSMIGKSGSVIEVKNQIQTTNAALEDLTANALNRQQVSRQSYMDGESRWTQSSAPMSKARQEAAVAPVGERSKVSAAELAKRGTPDNLQVVYSIDSVVEFPSRDGFVIRMDMTVEFELLPENIARIYMLYGDLPQVVEKIILPQVLSVSRLKGSNYKAQDFIIGDGREIFQNDLRRELATTMLEKKLLIHNAIIRNVTIPENILTPIRKASIAREQNLTNKSLQETARISAMLNEQNSLIEQKKEEVAQTTRKKVAEIMAEQEKQVRLINAQAELEVARLVSERAEIEARTARLRGEAEAKAAFLRDNERAQGKLMRAKALGDAGILADLQLVETLNPQIRVQVIHAGEGTLWTDMKNISIAMPAKGGQPGGKEAKQ